MGRKNNKKKNKGRKLQAQQARGTDQQTRGTDEQKNLPDEQTKGPVQQTRGPDQQTKRTYWTKEQAELYIRARPSFLEKDIQNCAEPIRAKLDGGQDLTDEERETLSRFYFNFGSIANCASDANFQSIAVDQLDLWIKHVANCLIKLTSDPRFVQTGVVSEHDVKMLDAMAAFAKHATVVGRMDRAQFLHVLSEFVAACAAPSMPDPAVAQCIGKIGNNFYITAVRQWTVREVFKELERSGLLGQMIRCATVPPNYTGEEEVYEMFLDRVLKNCLFIDKSFQKGRKTGDTLLAVLDGRDGYTGERNQRIVCRLTNLARFCDYANPEDRAVNHGCRKCGKLGEVQLCTRCDGTFP